MSMAIGHGPWVHVNFVALLLLLACLLDAAPLPAKNPAKI